MIQGHTVIKSWRRVTEDIMSDSKSLEDKYNYYNAYRIKSLQNIKERYSK